MFWTLVHNHLFESDIQRLLPDPGEREVFLDGLEWYIARAGLEAGTRYQTAGYTAFFITWLSDRGSLVTVVYHVDGNEIHLDAAH